MVKRAWIVLLALPLGCGNDNPGQPNPAPPVDAGGAGSDTGAPPTPPPPPTPAPMVTGTEIEHCPLGVGLGLLDAPVDLSNHLVQAWIPDSTTGLRLQTGLGHTDGTFEIEGVPEGARYLLQIDNSFFSTDQRAIDAGFVDTVRCHPQFARPAAPVTLALTNLSPFVDFDEITPMSLANDDIEFDPTNAVRGDTSIADTFDWFGVLPVASLDDDFTILHTTSDQGNTPDGRFRATTHIVDAFLRNDVSLTSGTPITVSGAFTPVPQATMPIALDVGPYLTPYQAVAPPDAFQIDLSAGPFGAAFRPEADLGSLFVAGFGLNSSTLTDEIPFADPFPATWERAALASAVMTRFYDAGNDRTFQINVGGEQRVSYTGTPAPTFAPEIPPASGLQVNGVDVSEGRGMAFDGKTPVTISWKAAEGATLYTVGVWQVDVGSPSFVASFIGSINTPETSVVVPASLFVDNRFYAFELDAFDHTPGYATGHLFEIITNFRQSMIASGRLRFSSTCGNGVTDFGEDCDDQGESAACNSDCTFSACGDGILNVTAGEACDTISDSATCASATCSLTTPAHAKPRTAAAAVAAAKSRQPILPALQSLPVRSRAWQSVRAKPVRKAAKRSGH